jgi:hypothetical protein
MRRSGNGEKDFLGAIDGVFAAAFAFVLLGIGFASVGGFGAASEAKAGIVEAGELALDGFGHPFRGNRGVNVREVIAAQHRARLRGRGGGHSVGCYLNRTLPTFGLTSLKRPDILCNCSHVMY